MEVKDFIDRMGVYDVVPRSAAAETVRDDIQALTLTRHAKSDVQPARQICVIRTRWVTVNNGPDDAPQLRSRWVAQEIRGRCGNKHEYLSETPDLA